MTDRVTAYYGQLARESDILLTGQFSMVGLAKLSADVLGTVTNVSGFTCTPTGPATLNVILTAGQIYQIENLEQSVWSSVPADTAHTVVKQGILLDPVTLAITPPGTVGWSQVYMIEVQYSDTDTGSVVLPYFNSAVPSSPFNGPGNSGTAQNTIRKGVCAVQVKAGTAAPTGTQVAPTQDVGWTGLFLVTVANGQGTITSGNIVTVPGAPFIPVTLPLVPAGVQNGTWVYAQDTGAVNAMVATVTPIPGGLVPGAEVRIKAANTNTTATTFNLNGLGANAVHRANGAALSAGDINANMVVALVWDGSAWQIQNYFGFTSSTINNNTFTLTIPYVVDSGAVNALVASFSPAITGPTAGQFVEVKAANANTGAATLNPNGLGAAAIVHADGSALNAGDIQAGGILLLSYDGTHWQLVSSSDLIIDSAVSFTVYGGGANFATLPLAMEYLSRYAITRNGSVALNLAVGAFSQATSMQLAHPNADRITIAGAALTGGAPSMANASTVFATGAGLAADRAAILTRLRAIYATELDFTGGIGAGIVVRSNGFTFKNLLIVGDRSWPLSPTDETQGIGLCVEGQTYIQNAVSVCNFGQCGLSASGAMVVVQGALTGSGCGGGVGGQGCGLAAALGGSIYAGINLTAANSCLIACANDSTGILSNITSSIYLGPGGTYAQGNGLVGDTTGGESYVGVGVSPNVQSYTPAFNVVGNFNSIVTN